ncbi:MAG TPA: FAD-dependent oxidoreductase [Thermoanaerobaculia bacterium]|nr:FAD-dependent oxidoreductase [Thermoanaerobaculia bacterium]
MPRPDVAVVGAGIVGAACASECAAAGLSVEVYDSGFAGGGTTAAAMGHIVVMDDSDAQLALTSLSRRLWAELAAELPPNCEDERTGTLWIAAGGSEMELVRGKASVYRARGIAVEELDAAALREAEPALRDGLAGALCVPDDRVVYPPNAARWLLERAEGRGAMRREREPVAAIGPRFVETASGRRDAGAVVNAAGAAAAALTPGLPIAPRKGHLVITDRYPGFARHQLVELGYLKSAHGRATESVAFNLQPRKTGQMLLGSSREFVGFDPTVNRSLRARMIGRALEYAPSLARLSAIRTWVGFRPATPDNLPLVGRWDPVPGLWIAAGHEGLGVTTALATARLIVDAMLGRRSEIDPAPYAPTRDLAASAHD